MQAVGFDAVREDREEAAEAVRAQPRHRVDDRVGVQRRLAAVELHVAVGGDAAQRLLEHRRRRTVWYHPSGEPLIVHEAAGAVAEVALVEVQLAQLGVAGGVVLDRLVERIGPSAGLAVGVVQAPVVGVVDDLVVLDARERFAGVLGDEAQHADAVVLGGAGGAGEVLGVHLEDARHEDAAGGVVDAAVPFVGEELLGRGAQRRLQALADVRRRAQRRAAVRAAVDGEMDARLAELAAQDLVLDVVEADVAAAGDGGACAGRTGRRASSTPTRSDTRRGSRAG